jgi:hypothetical protein
VTDTTAVIDTAAVIAALRKVAAGVQDLIDVLDSDSATTGKTQRERETALMKEFDRRPGDGLTREEASRACKRHGFMPQTVGAWVQGGYLELRDDGLRYMGKEGRRWLEEHGVEIANR